MPTRPLILPAASALPLVGRKEERQTLAVALGNARRHRGSTWLLEGEAGMGKTRLARWAEDEATRLRFQVRWGNCFKDSTLPFHSLQQAFRGQVPEIDTSRPPALVYLEYLKLLEDLSRKKPQLLVLDDIQWGDRGSLATFQFLARNVRSLPVVILATRRTAGIPAESEGNFLVDSEILIAMDREGTASRLKLRGLSEEEIGEVVRALHPTLWSTPGRQRALREFLRRSGGNPYLAISMAQMLTEEVGEVRDREDTSGILRLLPGSVQEAIRQRLARLLPEEREFLREGAVQGPEFRPDLVTTLLGIPRRTGTMITRALEHGQILQRSGRGGERFVFAHPMLWEAAREEEPEPVRARRAGRLAQWQVAHREGSLGEVARLFHEARDIERGIPWAERTVKEALRHHDGSLAERAALWKRDLEEMKGVAPARITAGLLETARALANIGDDLAAYRLSEAAKRDSLPPELMLEVNLSKVYALAAVNVRQAREVWESLASQLEDMKDIPRELYLNARGVEGLLLLREGRYRECQEVLDRPLREVRKSRDVGLRVTILYNWVAATTHLGQREGTKEMLEEAIKEAHQANLPRFEGGLYNALGDAHEVVGDLASAARDYEMCYSLSLRAGSMVNAAVALLNRSLILTDREDFPSALECVTRAEEIARKFGNPYVLDSVLYARGLLFSRQERWKEALELLSASMEMAEGGGFQDLAEYIAPPLALALGHTRRLVEAFAFLTSRENKIEEPSSLHRLTNARTRGELYLLGRDCESSRRELRGAIALMEAHAGGLSDHMRVWKLVAQVETRCGDPEAAARAVERMNDLRRQMGLTPLLAPGSSHPATGERKMTRGERVILHLSQQPRTGPGVLAPRTLTQQGISETVGIPQNALTTVLRQLEEGGTVVSDLAYIAGESRRKKSYRLTAAGEGVARELRTRPRKV